MSEKKQTAVNESAKQKAVEMVDRYLKCTFTDYEGTTETFDITEAKQCALIAVDEAIKAVDYVCTNDKIWWINHDFWQQVRAEIEKL